MNKSWEDSCERALARVHEAGRAKEVARAVAAFQPRLEPATITANVYLEIRAAEIADSIRWYAENGWRALGGGGHPPTELSEEEKKGWWNEEVDLPGDSYRAGWLARVIYDHDSDHLAES